MNVALAVLLVGLAAEAPARGAGGERPPADPARPLVRTIRGAEVDWGQGTIVARGGAAADFRLPSADVARPGAERRARAAALEKLRAALGELPLRGARKIPASAIDEALERAYLVRVDYQSNGGAVVALGVRFAQVAAAAAEARRAGRSPKGRPDADAGARPDAHAHEDHADDPETPTVVLEVGSTPLELAPEVVLGEREVTLGWAVYRIGAAPDGTRAISVKRDRAGRLVLPRGEADELTKVAGRAAVIYVHKPGRPSP